MGNAANHHASDNVWIDHRTTIVGDKIIQDRHLACTRVYFNERDMGLKGKARIHLYFIILIWQLTAKRYLPNMKRLQPRLHSFRQFVILLVGDFSNLFPS